MGDDDTHEHYYYHYYYENDKTHSQVVVVHIQMKVVEIYYDADDDDWAVGDNRSYLHELVYEEGSGGDHENNVFLDSGGGTVVVELEEEDLDEYQKNDTLVGENSQRKRCDVFVVREALEHQYDIHYEQYFDDTMKTFGKLEKDLDTDPEQVDHIPPLVLGFVVLIFEFHLGIIFSVDCVIENDLVVFDREETDFFSMIVWLDSCSMMMTRVYCWMKNVYVVVVENFRSMIEV